MRKTGCHCDENSTGEIYDDCVLDYGRRKDCSVVAQNYRIKRREDCKYWVDESKESGGKNGSEV